MKYYVELKILPSADVSQNFVWSKLFQEIHFAFIRTKDKVQSPLRVSFPEYSTEMLQLGSCLRIFSANEMDLIVLDLSNKLKGLQDYITIGNITEVPKSVLKFNVYGRVQPKTSIDRLIRRRMKRKNESEAEARKALSGFSTPKKTPPFIQLASMTTGKRFKLFIKLLDANDASMSFSAYGLGGAVPDF